MHTQISRTNRAKQETDPIGLPPLPQAGRDFRALNAEHFALLREKEEALRSILFDKPASLAALIVFAHEIQGDKNKIQDFFQSISKDRIQDGEWRQFQGHAPSIARAQYSCFGDLCASALSFGANLASEIVDQDALSEDIYRFLEKCRLSPNSLIRLADIVVKGIGAPSTVSAQTAQSILEKHPLSESECSAISRALDDVLASRSLLVELNIGMAQKAARSPLSALDHDDAFQAASAGLLKAIDYYNERLPFAFSTYAWYWIKREMSMAVSAAGPGPVGLPPHVRQSARKLSREEGKLNPDGTMPTEEDLARRLKMSTARVADLRTLRLTARSLEHPAFLDQGDSGEPLSGFIPDPSPISPPERAEASDLNEKLVSSLNLLTPVMRQVLDFTVYKGLSLRESGLAMGISYERVRQIKEDALKILRADPIVRELRGDQD